jgi:GNAT superfamily N-acetyltransferase
MTAVLPSVDPATIATFIEANINDYLLSYTRLRGAVLHADTESVWVEAGQPGAPANSIVWARFQSDQIDQQIESVLGHFRARAVPVVWHVGPTSEPADLGSALLRHGMTFDEEEPGMALDIDQMNDDLAAPPELTIEPVEDEAGLRDWVSVWLFPAPEKLRQAYFAVRRTLWLEHERPMHCFLGCWQGKPVATSMLYLGKGVAAVHHVVTLPEYRRRGIGSAMTLRVLHEARERGYRVGVLTASPDGSGSYRKIGFREYCSVRRYEWEPNDRP